MVVDALNPDEALYTKVARKVLSETLRMRKGETLTIETWNNGLPLAKVLTLEARRMGVVPLTVFEDEEGYVEGVKTTPKDLLGTMGRHEFGLLSGSDAYVFIPGPPIGAYSPRLTQQENSDSTRYNSSWYEAAEKARLRGARLPFGYVGRQYANQYGRKPDEFARHQLRAALADFGKISAAGRQVADLLRDGAEATLVTGAAKLNFALGGEAEVEDGIVDEGDVNGGYNMTYVPPGYVMKPVAPKTASGKVKLSPSMTRLGLLRDAELEFQEGRLVGWKSRGSERMLDWLLEAFPPEKRTVSSVIIGLNPLMRYEYGQDRMVSGAVSLTGFGFVGAVRKGTLSVGGATIVQRGRLSSFP